ncbi:unnamed protein product, partial [Polarella glacialis]
GVGREKASAGVGSAPAGFGTPAAAAGVGSAPAGVGAPAAGVGTPAPETPVASSFKRFRELDEDVLRDACKRRDLPATGLIETVQSRLAVAEAKCFAKERRLRCLRQPSPKTSAACSSRVLTRSSAAAALARPPPQPGNVVAQPQVPVSSTATVPQDASMPQLRTFIKKHDLDIRTTGRGRTKQAVHEDILKAQWCSARQEALQTRRRESAVRRASKSCASLLKTILQIEKR